MAQQLSQVFGLENPATDIHLDNLSAADESDEENRDDEIKKLLEEGLSNETFDYDSDGSSHNGSKFSNHNNCSFVSNKDGTTRNNGLENEHNGDGDGDNMVEEGLFQTPRVNGKRVDFSMIPNAIQQQQQQYEGINNNIPRSNGGGSGLLKNNGFGGLLKPIPENGNGNGLGHDSSILITKTKVNGNNGIKYQQQTNRGSDEIEETNPTISLLHQEHCPRTENEGLTGNGIWLSAENNMEQLKTLCEFRERQIQRAESTIATLQKDKRALNHQIGLMKTEMVQMKSQNDEAEKIVELKDQDVNYLKTKIQEVITEYEQARNNEEARKEDNRRLLTEIDKLNQEVTLLSSLGSSTQQAEVNDVVRQLREKHAKDIAAWQKVIAELEGQIRTYKRTQQLLHEDSITVLKENAQTQTEYRFEEEIEIRERELAAEEFQEEFGGCGDAFIEEIKNLPEREIVKRVRLEWRTERLKLINHFQSEIKIYRHKLANLPSELYQMWQQTQEELGLNRPVVIRPLCRAAGTMTDEICIESGKTTSAEEKSTSFNLSFVEEKKSFKDESVQVNFAAVLANAESETTNADASPNPPVNNSNLIKSSSALDEKETSSVIVQTDESLETYKMLASMIDGWVREVNITKQRAELAESKNQSVEEELKNLNEKFNQVQKMAVSCRREWKKQEDNLRMKNATMKNHYVEMLKNLNNKLNLIDDPDLIK